MPNRTRLTAAQYRERGIALPFRPTGPAPLRFESPMVPAVPMKRSPFPKPPQPGERIDANGNAVRDKR